MSVRPFFSYYGGKWRTAPRYPRPMYDTIVEPFAGSAGYALRHAHLRVVLVDADPVIAGIWAYLLRVSESEIRGLPDVVGDVADLDVCEEARNLIGFWLARGSTAPNRTPGAWMRAGIKPGSFWGDNARHRIATQLHRIRHWKIIHGGFEDAPDEPATWFIDPPYEEAGKHYRCSDVDYEALGVWCRSRRGQVMVCENEGATWLPFEPFLDAKAMNGASREALWHVEGSPMFGGRR